MGPVDDTLVAACLEAHRGYQRHLRRLAGTVRADSPNNRVDSWFIRRFHMYDEAFCHHSWLDTKKSKQAAHYEMVVLNNSKYSARAARNSEADVLTVRGIGAPTSELFTKSAHRLGNSLWSPIMLRERVFDEWLRTPGFRITGATLAGDLVTLAVIYENSIENTKETYECPFSGTVHCDPRHEYRIVNTDLVVTFRFSGSPLRQRRLVTKCEYDSTTERFAVPKRVTIAVENDAGVVEPHSTWYTSDVEPVKSADERFTLSYYGLPEPFGVEWERPTPWWLYAGIGAGVLVVLIFLLGLWKRRLLARG
jgi:hypothetical protein